MAKVNKSKRKKKDQTEDIFTEVPVVEFDVSSLSEEVTAVTEDIGSTEDEEEIVEALLDEILEDEDVIEVDLIGDPVDEAEESADTEEGELEILLEELKDMLPPDELKHYSLRSLREFKESGTRQSRTPRGNYKYARTRSIDLDKWSVDELEDWLEGRIVGHPSLNDEDIFNEVYLRWLIPSNWTHEDVLEHVLHHTLPETTATGELIRDRRRESSELDDMTFSMLCSIYLKEVDTKHSSEDALKRLKIVIRASSDKDLEDAIEQYLSGRTLMSNKIEQLISVLDTRKSLFRDYGKQLTETTIANNQKLFYNHLRSTCKLDYAEFAEAWRSLLRYVDKNYAELFVATKVRRGWGSLELSKGQLATFDRLLTLILGTRNAASRHKDAQVFKLDYILEFVNDPKERENILTFYQQ